MLVLSFVMSLCHLLQGSQFVQDLVLLIKKRAPHQTYRCAACSDASKYIVSHIV